MTKINFLFHIFGGILFVTVFLFLFGQFNDLSLGHIFDLLLLYCLAIFASILPDVDNRSSLIWKIANFFLLIFLIVWAISKFGFNPINLGIACILFLAWYFIISKIIVPRHRGIVHSLAFNAVLTILVFVASGFDFLVAGVFFVSYWSHMCLDIMPFKLI